MGKLDGHVALVTGAARGQGEADARLFAAEGATVVLADTLVERGQDAAARIGVAAEFEPLDVADETAWSRLVARISDRHGRLDVLVNNAGIAQPHSMLRDTSLADFERALSTNVIGVFLGMKWCTDLLAASAEGGSIINIASTSGVRASRARIAYTATKFALRGMTRVAAMELAPLGIRVNAVLPGAVDTEMIRPSEAVGDESQSESLRRYLERVPLGRVGSPDELARLVLFLASRDSSYCTGADFTADGGFLVT